MLLTSLLEGINYEIIKGDTNKSIQAIAYDSNEVKAGSIFVAITGYASDGHRYIAQAIERGATAIIIEKNIEYDEEQGITVIKVNNSRRALAKIATNYYQHPTEKFNLIGITGTNGKTSISYFLKSIFEEAKQTLGVIGTIGTVINNKLTKNDNTTPESLILQNIFAKMVHEKVDNCIMEVSSHALDLERVAFSNFNTGIFTNLTPDHLELHKNMDAYFQAKEKLFKQTSAFNIINADDAYGQKLIDLSEHYDAKTISYGLHNNADIYATDITYHFNETSYTVNTPTGSERITVNLPGEIYVYNSLAAIACAYYHGIPLPTIQKGIQNLEGIKGRFEVVYEKEDFKVIIDFAHTEDALEKTLTTIQPFVKGRIILVFGVYADNSKNGRDKRFGMGRVAAKHADISIVTLDNPKHFDQNIIMKEIGQAIELNNGTYQIIHDREEAIKHAIQISNANDMIVIAGKGHESTQVINGVEIPFNETEIVLESLTEQV